VAVLALRIALVAALYAFLLLVLRFSARGLQASSVPRASALAPQGRVLRLIVVEGGSSGLASGQVIDVAEGATLGRTAAADVVVGDPSVSASHARLSRQGRTWTLSDLDSTNGTLVNGARVEAPVALLDGDVVGLGSVRLKVVARRGRG